MAQSWVAGRAWRGKYRGSTHGNPESHVPCSGTTLNTLWGWSTLGRLGVTLPTQYYIPASGYRDVKEDWGLTFDQKDMSKSKNSPAL